MKGKNRKKILKLFDYFKIAFNLNMNNKQLYKPQIMYLLLRGVLILIAGLSFIELSQNLLPFVGAVSFTKFFSLFWSQFRGTPLLVLIVTLLVMIFGSTYVEAGLYSMYSKINRGEGGNLVFASGANKYFLTFLGGNLLILLFWIIAALPFIIVGMLTLTIGFTWIPIIVSALLMVWKASVVSDDVGIFEALGNSYRFGKKNFMAANVFIIIKSAISSISGGGSGGSGNGGANFQNNFNGSNGGINNMPFDFPGSSPNMRFGDIMNQGIISTVIAVGTSIISLMTVFVGLINMLFEIFFGLTTVIIYQDAWQIEEEVVVEDISDSIASTDMEVE